MVTTLGVPPVHIVEPAANPAPGGLYSAALVTDIAGPSRIAGGIVRESRNIGGHGQWPLNGADVGDDDVKGGGIDCASLADFDAIGVWASNDSALPGMSEQDASLSAHQTLRLTEPVEVEEFLAPKLIEAATETISVGDSEGSAIVAALSAVESQAAQTGMQLVIHAPRSVAALAASKALVVRTGNRSNMRLETPLGNVWAFGTGYGELGNVLVATGPVTVHRSPVVESQAIETKKNHRLVIVEREVAVTWDGDVIAAHYKEG